MLEQLTSEQVSEWQAYDALEPIGEWKDDYRTALICSVVTNLAISLFAKQDTKKTKLNDFILQWGLSGDSNDNNAAIKPKQSVDDMKAILYAIAARAKKTNKLPVK